MSIKSLLINTMTTFGALAVISNSASAELICAGTVEEIAYHANDQVMVRLSSMNTPVFFCNPEITWTVAGTGYTTGPKTCAAMYSTFLALKLSGKPITTMYFDGAAVPASCNAWAQWSNANIRHYKF